MHKVLSGSAMVVAMGTGLGVWLTLTPLQGRPSTEAGGVVGRAVNGSTADWLSPIEPVTSPASPDSAQPQLTVQTGSGQAGANDRLVLSWVERSAVPGSTSQPASVQPTSGRPASGQPASGQNATRATLKVAEWSSSTSSGWSEAKTVASGDNFFVNWADVPSVRGLADGSLAAHWLQKSGAGTYAYDVRLSFSKDGGRTWTPSVTPHHDGTQTEHGFASLFQAPGAGAGLGLVWLDGRAMKSGSHGAGAGAGAGSKGTASRGAGSHDTGTGGAMSVRSAIYNPDGTQQPGSEVAIDTRVCECCPTAAAITADGPIVAFRNRSEKEIRDIYVSRLVNGRWTEPVAGHEDGWYMPACPVNGPALSAIGRRVALAWFTMKEDQGHAFVAFSDDAGRTFGKPIRLDDEMSLGRVDAELLPDGSAVAAWIEFSNGEQTAAGAAKPAATASPAPAAPQPSASFRIRRIDRSGKLSAAVTVTGLNSSRTSGYPRIARAGNDLLFAWTDTSSTPRVTTARARLMTSAATTASPSSSPR
jgi:hypothetical protein